MKSPYQIERKIMMSFVAYIFFNTFYSNPKLDILHIKEKQNSTIYNLMNMQYHAAINTFLTHYTYIQCLFYHS